MLASQGSASRNATPLARFQAYFESLTPLTLTEIGRIYAADARFRDPFNAVQGLDAVRSIFAHMFVTTEQPRFVVLHALGDATQGYVTWDFHFRSKGRGGRNWTIHGASRLEFNAQGLVALHRDYWDAAEELYEHLPLLGALLRTVKSHLRAI
ncbi:MAG: nuclear transport factor 2 family protein [Betaproteobacteria bacterium]|nr:nuclear transport factor 2 family protein [Betaproteobacteria bacterium]